MSTQTNEAKENDVFGVAAMPCRMNSVKMVTNGNCKEYVLYVNSKDRMNARVENVDLMPFLEEATSDVDKKLFAAARVGGVELNYINFIRQKNTAAFEPNNLNYSRLKKNVDINKFKISCHNYACSDKKEQRKLWFTDKNKRGGSSVLTVNDQELKISFRLIFMPDLTLWI